MLPELTTAEVENRNLVLEPLTGIRLAVITRKPTSSRQRRSIPRLERSPTAYAYNNSATIIAGSNAARPQPSSR